MYILRRDNRYTVKWPSTSEIIDFGPAVGCVRVLQMDDTEKPVYATWCTLQYIRPSREVVHGEEEGEEDDDE